MCWTTHNSSRHFYMVSEHRVWSLAASISASQAQDRGEQSRASSPHEPPRCCTRHRSFADETQALSPGTWRHFRATHLLATPPPHLPPSGDTVHALFGCVWRCLVLFAFHSPFFWFCMDPFIPIWLISHGYYWSLLSQKGPRAVKIS